MRMRTNTHQDSHMPAHKYAQWLFSNHIPHVGNDPTPAPEGEQTLDPTTVANPTGNAALLRTIPDIHRLQQENMRRKGAGRKGKSKGKGSGDKRGRSKERDDRDRRGRGGYEGGRRFQ